LALAAALSNLFADRKSWENRRKMGREFVEQHRNWSSNISRYGPVYHKLTGLPV
jgi:glycogen synthase